MHSNSSIDQLSLNMATFYEPEKNHQATLRTPFSQIY